VHWQQLRSCATFPPPIVTALESILRKPTPPVPCRFKNQRWLLVRKGPGRGATSWWPGQSSSGTLWQIWANWPGPRRFRTSRPMYAAAGDRWDTVNASTNLALS
jgi:hypothetical protein